MRNIYIMKYVYDFNCMTWYLITYYWASPWERPFLHSLATWSTLSRYGALWDLPLQCSIYFCLLPVWVMFRQPFDNRCFNKPEFKSHNGLIVSIITKDDDILKNMVYSLDILYRIISLDPYPILIVSTMQFYAYL